VWSRHGVGVFVVHGFPAWTVYPVMLRRLGGAALVEGCYTRVTAIALLPVLLAALLVHAGLGDRCTRRSCPDAAR
jgi:hypothetical protein